MQLCGTSARSKHVEALNDAGFIGIFASRPLALARSQEQRRIREERADSKICEEALKGWRDRLA